MIASTSWKSYSWDKEKFKRRKKKSFMQNISLEMISKSKKVAHAFLCKNPGSLFTLFTNKIFYGKQQKISTILSRIHTFVWLMQKV